MFVLLLAFTLYNLFFVFFSDFVFLIQLSTTLYTIGDRRKRAQTLNNRYSCVNAYAWEWVLIKFYSLLQHLQLRKLGIEKNSLIKFRHYSNKTKEEKENKLAREVAVWCVSKKKDSTLTYYVYFYSV